MSKGKTRENTGIPGFEDSISLTLSISMGQINPFPPSLQHYASVMSYIIHKWIGIYVEKEK